MNIVMSSDSVSWLLPATLDQWLRGLAVPAASAIANAIESGAARLEGEEVTVTAREVASWPESTATALGLPPNVPLGLDIRLSGAIGKRGASIAARWLQPGRVVPARITRCEGLWLDVGEQKFRVASPFFEVLELVGRFNAIDENSLEEHFRAWAEIRACLGEERSSALTDGFLRSFRVVSASALTLAISTDERGDLQIAPVLLTAERAPDGDRVEHVRALTEADESLFPKRLDQLREGVPAFPVSQGTYVVVDEPLRKALAAVRSLRKGSPEQRKRAAMFPEAVIRECLGVDDSEPTVFIETERFADRVMDVGEWSAPVLPWIKIAPQDWGVPDTAGVRIGGVDVPLDGPTLDQALGAMRDAIEKGHPKIEINDQSIPATSANLQALEQLKRAVDARDRGGPLPEKTRDTGTQVLLIETNFNEASFSLVSVGQRRAGQPVMPGGLKTAPKPHQEIGVQWLQQHWMEGSRGALLCDDMGLGKTFQALAFCQWLRELMDRKEIARKPLLIVAPVGLLRNWEAEIAEHLLEPGLGTIVRAYGDHLRGLRRGQHLAGTAGLDTARLAGGDVILANYEAVTDYQLSFGAVQYGAVVLDEAQKIKSPKARMTHAAKALNAEFFVAMTGTPVENRLADLWCIADAVQPGALADLKTFSARYESDGADVGELRRAIWQDEPIGARSAPRLLLRRLKTDKLEGLPGKFEHVIRTPMPDGQVEAYQRALALKEISGPEGTLGMIHALRRISLHPVLAGGGQPSDELRFEDSARFQGATGALDRIYEKGEKALIFLESLDLQDAGQLPLLLQRRYNLARLPMVINGQVSTEARQARVDLFQRERGFDVMLLSPRAGGVGLTLTAANHVIHLSRWWNPAVEDQCSDRVYRIGQNRPVHIYYPLAVLPDTPDSSFDVQLQILMDRKRKLALDLLAAPAFTREDYEVLLAGALGARTAARGAPPPADIEMAPDPRVTPPTAGPESRRPERASRKGLRASSTRASAPSSEKWSFPVSPERPDPDHEDD